MDSSSFRLIVARGPVAFWAVPHDIDDLIDIRLVEPAFDDDDARPIPLAELETAAAADAERGESNE